jgi:peptide/nickel transport system substrate-binding protein
MPSVSAPVLGFLNNVYEGLVRRGRDMAIEGSLATSWEPIGDGEGWRFNLREGVTFHDGRSSPPRMCCSPTSARPRKRPMCAAGSRTVSDVVVVDDYTVDILTTSPQPLFPDSIANWMMMDSGWAEANDAGAPARDTENFATRNVNGTGPFMLQSRQPDLETVLVPFDGWWGEASHGITEAVFTPIQNSATAVAALLSGEVDLINPVPVQDAERVDGNDGTSVIRGIESRVIMLGFAHDHETLRNGAENPFGRRARAPGRGPCGERARDPADDHAGLGRACGATGGGRDVGLFRCQRGTARLRSRTVRARCWPRRAIRTGSRLTCPAPTTAISTTRRCVRRLSACWRRWA